jgi:hypothetical protein
MQATAPEQAPGTLPAEFDFDAIVAESLANPEIVAGAGAAGVPVDDLRDAVSRDRALAGARVVLDELATIESRERIMRDAEPAAPPSPSVAAGFLRALADALRSNVASIFAPLLRLFGVTPQDAVEQPGEAALEPIEAERAATLERLRAALSEQVLRDLRSAVEQRTEDSFSTLLKVSHAPGLAQLVDDDYGVPTRATEELADVFVAMPGGSIGLAGRRGIGKSKLIQRSCPPPQIGRDPLLLATVVSAPTEYDGRDFVLHLFASICETVVGGAQVRAEIVRSRERATAPAQRLAPAALVARARRPLLCVGAVAILAAALDVQPDALLIAGGVLCLVAVLLPGDWIEGGHGLIFPSTPSLPLAFVGLILMAGSAIGRVADPLRDAGIIAVAIALALLLTPKETIAWRPQRAAGDYNPGPFPDELATTAHDRLDDIEFQRTIAAGWTGAVGAKLGAGPAELNAQSSVSGTRTLARVPLSFPEIVARLRAFLALAATSAEVRIGIDELDKIESEETAHRFLNEIKGVFGIPRCFFLVSVSEEALSNFDRRGAGLRDVFDSSFDEILYVPPLTFAESVALLRQRVIGLPVPYLALCHVLSGGLPRDLIRVARAAIGAKPDDGDGRLVVIATKLVERELQQRVRAVSVVAAGLRLEPQTSAFLRWARGLTGDVTSDGLLRACSGGEEFRSSPGDGGKLDGGDRTAFMQIADLTLELKCFCYFASTLIDYFNLLVIAREQTDAPFAPAAEKDIERLMEARATASANPRVGWGLITAFRSHQQTTTRELPDS